MMEAILPLVTEEAEEYGRVCCRVSEVRGNYINACADLDNAPLTVGRVICREAMVLEELDCYRL